MIAGHALGRWLLIGVMLALLVGCRSTDSTAAPPTVPTGVVAPVTLVLWHGWSGQQRQTLSRLVDRFNLAHPDGRVRLQAMPLATLNGDLRAAALDGTGPHLALLPNTWVGSLAPILLPLDDLIPQAERDALLPAALGGAQLRDSEGTSRLYGLPIHFDTLALFFNRSNVLQPPETTADLLRLARGFSSPTDTPPRWGLALDLSMDNMLCYLYAFDGQVFDQGGALVLGGAGRNGAERWLGWMATLNADHAIFAHPDSGLQVDRALKNNRALMSFGWAHQVDEFRRLWNDQMGVAPLPNLSETGRSPVPFVQSELLVLNGRVSEAERRAATTFARFLITSEVQQELLESGLQPARRTLDLGGDSPQLLAAQVFRTQAERGLPMPNSPTRDLVREQLRLMQQRVLADGILPRDAVSETAQRLRDLLGQ